MQQTVKQLKTAAIVAAIQQGDASPMSVRRLLRQAANSISPMSVAGVKAAIVKGQSVASIKARRIPA